MERRKASERRQETEDKSWVEYRKPFDRRIIGGIIVAVLVIILFAVFKGKPKEEAPPVPPVAEKKSPQSAPAPAPAPALQGAEKKGETWSGKAHTNSIGMKFVLKPAGTFMMGSPSNEPLRNNNEIQHKVTISPPYYLQTTEITQGQWKMIMGNNPSSFANCGDDCPVEKVSWNDAQEFIRKLNQKENTSKYRLPTEAEWEYAVRSGGKDEKWAGTSDELKLKNYAWYDHNSTKKTHPVGQKRPNGLGLYDMTGNVFEWCQDWYGDYPSGSVTDPTGPLPARVVCFVAAPGMLALPLFARLHALKTLPNSPTFISASVLPGIISYILESRK